MSEHLVGARRGLRVEPSGKPSHALPRALGSALQLSSAFRLERRLPLDATKQTSIDRGLRGDEVLNASLGRIRELIGEAGCNLPADLFAGVA